MSLEALDENIEVVLELAYALSVRSYRYQAYQLVLSLLMDEAAIRALLKEQYDVIYAELHTQLTAVHVELQAIKGLGLTRHRVGGDPGLPRSMRLEVLKFNDTDPERCIFAIREYFDLLEHRLINDLRCGGKGRRGGSMEGSGGGWLAKCSIVSNEGCGGGGLAVCGGKSSNGAGGGEVNGRGVVVGVFKSLLGEIPDDVMGERGGDTSGLIEEPFGNRWAEKSFDREERRAEG
ncbi:hypothetical protein Tco_0431317 [Tanacetum coccineum]